MWFFIGDVTRIDGELHPDSWILRAFSEIGNSELIFEDSARRYLVSLYWSITTLTTVGYGIKLNLSLCRLSLYTLTSLFF